MMCMVTVLNYSLMLDKILVLYYPLCNNVDWIFTLEALIADCLFYVSKPTLVLPIVNFGIVIC